MPDEELKNVHFRVPHSLWLRMRMLFPEKGSVQEVCAIALERFLTEKERERASRAKVA